MKANIEFYKLLSRSDFFQQYSRKQLKKLSKYFIWSSYIEGEVIYREGNPGKEMAVMLYGEAKVSALENDQRIDLAILKEGDIFGETAMIIEQPRFATVIAYTNCN